MRSSSSLRRLSTLNLHSDLSVATVSYSKSKRKCDRARRFAPSIAIQKMRTNSKRLKRRLPKSKIKFLTWLTSTKNGKKSNRVKDWSRVPSWSSEIWKVLLDCAMPTIWQSAKCAATSRAASLKIEIFLRRSYSEVTSCKCSAHTSRAWSFGKTWVSLNGSADAESAAAPLLPFSCCLPLLLHLFTRSIKKANWKLIPHSATFWLPTMKKGNSLLILP